MIQYLMTWLVGGASVIGIFFIVWAIVTYSESNVDDEARKKSKKLP